MGGDLSALGEKTVKLKGLSATWTTILVGLLASAGVYCPAAAGGELEDELQSGLRQGRVTQAYVDRALAIAAELRAQTARRIEATPDLTDEAIRELNRITELKLRRLGPAHQEDIRALARNWELDESARLRVTLEGPFQPTDADGLQSTISDELRRHLDLRERELMDPVREAGPRATSNGAIPLDELLQSSRTRARFALHMDGAELERLGAVEPAADDGRAQACQTPEMAKAWQIGTLQAFSGKRHLEKHQMIITSSALEACIEMIPEFEHRDQIAEVSTENQRKARYCCQQGFRRGQEAFNTLLTRNPPNAGADFAACREEFESGKRFAANTVCTESLPGAGCGAPQTDRVWPGCVTTGFVTVAGQCMRARSLASVEERARIAANRECTHTYYDDLDVVIPLVDSSPGAGAAR